MTHQMYSIKDKLNGFIPPIPIPDDDVAQRWFKEMIHENTTMKLSPNDFELWHLGEWDNKTGEFTTNIYVVAMKGGMNGSNI